jgi:hypothetical protein
MVKWFMPWITAVSSSGDQHQRATGRARLEPLVRTRCGLERMAFDRRQLQAAVGECRPQETTFGNLETSAVGLGALALTHAACTKAAERSAGQLVKHSNSPQTAHLWTCCVVH